MTGLTTAGLPDEARQVVSRYLRIVDAASGPPRTGAFPARWHGIIKQALRCRPVPLRLPESPDAVVARRAEASDFLAFAIDAIRNDAACGA